MIVLSSTHRIPKLNTKAWESWKSWKFVHTLVILMLMSSQFNKHFKELKHHTFSSFNIFDWFQLISNTMFYLWRYAAATHRLFYLHLYVTLRILEIPVNCIYLKSLNFNLTYCDLHFKSCASKCSKEKELWLYFGNRISSSCYWIL